MIEPGLRLIGSSIKHSPSKLFPLNHSVHSMRPLTLQSINPALLKVEYAVRGELAIKAEKYRVELKEGNKSLPFKKVISSNIGNPQQKGLDQPPITFTRQVAALTEWPTLMELAPNVFPKDVISRANELLSEIGSIGAYSHSQGIPFIRQNVAKFIQRQLISFHIPPSSQLPYFFHFLQNVTDMIPIPTISSSPRELLQAYHFSFQC
jgi:hypothetical protein